MSKVEILPGYLYRHVKRDTVYIVYYVAVRERDCTLEVVYQMINGEGNVWVRPLSEFEDGRYQPFDLDLTASLVVQQPLAPPQP